MPIETREICSLGEIISPARIGAIGGGERLQGGNVAKPSLARVYNSVEQTRNGWQNHPPPPMFDHQTPPTPALFLRSNSPERWLQPAVTPDSTLVPGCTIPLCFTAPRCNHIWCIFDINPWYSFDINQRCKRVAPSIPQSGSPSSPFLLVIN